MEKMPTAGSAREFFRIKDSADFVKAGFKPLSTVSAVVMKWCGDDPDWDYFLALNKIEKLANIIPTIIEEKRAESKVLVRDCGKFTLKDLFEANVGNIEKQKILLAEVAKILLNWQSVKVPEENTISKRIFTTPDLLWETDYFREHISPIFVETKFLFQTKSFEDERKLLAQKVDNLPKCLMHRDFQSENIVFSDDFNLSKIQTNFQNDNDVQAAQPIKMTAHSVSLVDVQGARIGAKHYDVASLVFDPYLYPKITTELREYFLQKMQSNKKAVYLCALQRLMQAMGAYGNLSSNKKKPHYRAFIKPAAIQAKWICEELAKKEKESFDTLLKIFSAIS